jgi:hypothetical protein
MPFLILRITVATAAAMLASCATQAHPQRDGYPAPNPIASGRLADIAVIDRNTGERLPVYWHNGRRHVAGTPGHRYAIEVASRSSARVLAVISVDGVNAVTGETAAWEQSGYVFMPWQRWEVRGWRKSNERVAAFEFTALSNSYAARTGRPHDVGVIGVALFRERVRPRVVEPQIHSDRRGSNESAGAASEAPQDFAREQSEPAAPSADRSLQAAPRRQERLGTGHGQSEWSAVGETEFVRARPTPDEIITIHYDSRENLIATGVIPRHWPTVAEPNPNPIPFPAARGFVPDPPAWR